MTTESLLIGPGHIGNLTPEQEAVFEQFKKLLQEAQLYTPVTETAEASHDDVTLVRFLRARRFEADKARDQFAKTEAWRKQWDVDSRYNSFDPIEFESIRRFYPRWTGRRNKQGLPVYVYRIGSLDSSIQSKIHAVSAKRRTERIFVLYEALCRFILPMVSSLPRSQEHIPISSTMSIIDLQGASLRQMWTLRSHFQEASTLATANYPETLGLIAVVNSPSFFPTVWDWIKGWFDEGTREKIFILGKDPGVKLLSIVDAENLPKAYGGELDWKFEDEPSLDEAAKAAIGEMPKGPVAWMNGTVIKLKSNRTG